MKKELLSILRGVGYIIVSICLAILLIKSFVSDMSNSEVIQAVVFAFALITIDLKEQSK